MLGQSLKTVALRPETYRLIVLLKEDMQDNAYDRVTNAGAVHEAVTAELRRRKVSISDPETA